MHHHGYEFYEPFSKPFLVYEPWKSPHYEVICFTKVVGHDDKLTMKMKMSVYSLETGQSQRACVLGDEDLLTEILLRLPAKDALRCKSVCKKWRTIISDGRFCYRHTLGHPTPYPSGIILCQQQFDFKKPRLIPFSNNNNNSSFIHHHLDLHNNEFHRLLHYEIQQSSNGLLLWKSTPGILLLQQQPLDMEAMKLLLLKCFCFYVTNPTTGSCLRIHHCDYELYNEPFSKPFLVYEPWKSLHYEVIFFTKVVGHDDKLTMKMKMSVYSSETGTWSKLDLLPYFPYDIDRSNAIYCNGAIHWFVLHGLSVYLDINSLCLKVLPGVRYSRWQKFLNFGECGGNLHLVWLNWKEKLSYDIWELKEDYSEWIVRYHLDLTSLRRQAHTINNMLSVVRQPPNKDEGEESKFAILVVDNNKLDEKLGTKLICLRGTPTLPLQYPTD
ncbi:hypothetical protein PIB30_043662 [Stylosanthes scabra]|uniref:F-box domain-containing protein n=1 Tax=Stylosanthes scabra TaxID=79078 RepID=A0ABU6ZEB5_9FABA|nr:hypothetical protein [Stylosanthes scabra]